MNTSTAPKLRRFVAINYVVIKMLDASISIDADLMEGERLCTLMGRCEPGWSLKLSNARQPMAEAKKWPNAANWASRNARTTERDTTNAHPALHRSRPDEDGPTRTFRKLSRASVE
jgi:hypothetical protein